MDKDKIRIRVKARKSLLSAQERLEAARRIFDLVEHSAPFMMAEHILMYHSLPDEVSTHEFIDRWHTRKHFYLPRVNGVNLELLPYDRSRLHLGAFNIEEPDGHDTVDPSSIELAIVPGVAYDRQGNRLGRGRGFYDRLLHDTGATTIGVAYECQMCDDLEPEPHDGAVHFVITEEGVYHP